MRKIAPHSWSVILLFAATFIWGLSYVINRSALNHDLNPIAFAGLRYLFGTISILPMALRWRRHPGPALYGPLTLSVKYSWLWGGAICGVLLALASMLQLYGMSNTTAGKAGFITTLYVTMVPVLGFVLGQIPKLMVWLALVFGLIGLYILTGGGGAGSGGFSRGDAVIVVADFFWATHVLVMGFFAGKSNPWLFIFGQSFASCLICLGISISFGLMPTAAVFWATLPATAWGIVSVGVAYVFQIMGQRNTPPTATAMIMQLQAVVAVLAGAVFLDESITKNMLVGAVILLSGSLLANLSPNPIVIAPDHHHYKKVKIIRFSLAVILAVGLIGLFVWALN